MTSRVPRGSFLPNALVFSALLAASPGAWADEPTEKAAEPAPAPAAATDGAAAAVPVDAAPLVLPGTADPDDAPLPLEDPIPPVSAVPYRPFNIGLLYPMSINVGAPESFTHLDLALLFGRVGYLGGLQMGPIGYIGYAMRGVQLGLVHVVDGPAEGLQIDGFFAISRGDLFGAQIVGALGWSSANVHGAAIAGLGSQVYGDVDGLLAAGLLTVARGEVRGVEIAGGVNIGRVDGLQLGLINISAEIHGVQIGVINVARRLKGVQIGVLNVTDKLEGESLGVIPLPRRGGIHPMAWGSNTIFANLGLKFASAHTYSLLSGGLHNRPLPDGKRQAAFAAGFTMGAALPLVEGFKFAADLGAYRLFADGGLLARHDELYKLRLLFSFVIAPRLVPFIGGGVAMAVQGADSVRYSFLPEGTAGIEL